MIDAIQYFPYIYMVLRAKYLSRRGSGSPTYRTLKQRGVLKASLYLGHIDL